MSVALSTFAALSTKIKLATLATTSVMAAGSLGVVAHKQATDLGLRAKARIQHQAREPVAGAQTSADQSTKLAVEHAGDAGTSVLSSVPGVALPSTPPPSANASDRPEGGHSVTVPGSVGVGVDAGVVLNAQLGDGVNEAAAVANGATGLLTGVVHEALNSVAAGAGVQSHTDARADTCASILGTGC